jgi:hypothetical protein
MLAEYKSSEALHPLLKLILVGRALLPPPLANMQMQLLFKISVPQ